MARVTVEDCVLKVPNRFELVLLAAKRAKDIEKGAIPSVPKDNDKPTIIALREIAEETISTDGLRQVAIQSMSSNAPIFTEGSASEEDPEDFEDEESEIEESELSTGYTIEEEK